jgi:hypothetical protein
MKHYPKLTEHGSITRPSNPPHAPERVWFVYDDIGRLMGVLGAWDVEYAKALADRKYGANNWSAIQDAQISG